MVVQLGTNPIAWSNDDDHALGAEISLETCLADTRAAGFTGIEMGHKFPRTAKELKDVLHRHGLRLVSGWYSANLLERDAAAEFAAMQDHLALLRALGCNVMVLCETTGAVHGDPRRPVFAARPQLDAAAWQRFTQRLEELARRMAEMDMGLAYHHHMGTVVQHEAEIDRLMADTDPAVGLLFDTGHLAFAGGDPAAVAQRHAARINHVHTKDIRRDVIDRAQAEDWSFLATVREGGFTVPGDGALDFDAALAPLAQHGYAGWIVVEAEQDPAKADPSAYARFGQGQLKACLDRLGLAVATA